MVEATCETCETIFKFDQGAYDLHCCGDREEGWWKRFRGIEKEVNLRAYVYCPSCSANVIVTGLIKENILKKLIKAREWTWHVRNCWDWSYGPS